MLRLTLPGDVEELPPPPDQANAELPPPTVTAQQIDAVSPPLLTCAAKIANFPQMNAFDATVVKRLKVQPHGHKSTIAWGRFCYGPTAASYGDLVKRLDPGSPERAALSHPIAVYGTV
ncbi:hypothetical protein [Streptomyces sp. NPDC048385]|uniref:hypothetical protein n=1 Tax=unclassified Streptomyces TaxID=2593676 RepID=UPI00344160FF